MAKSLETVIGKSRSWAKAHGLHGPGAFLRFVMMTFVERLNQVSEDFVFKGGNLLWIYIQTPRSTVDLDFSTNQTVRHDFVEDILQKVCLLEPDGLTFSLKSFEKIDRMQTAGASVRIGYLTREGQANEFEVDIVYGLPAIVRLIPSPLNEGSEILAATLENIVADKLSAAQSFKAGNSRMKDFDDLWRIAHFKPNLLDWNVLSELLKKRGITPVLELTWINPVMSQSWSTHIANHSDLPTDLRCLMNEVNQWLKNGLCE